MNSTTSKTIEIVRSRRGIPALWEQGGGLTNTGTSRIITDRYGNAKRALYVRTHGDLACGNHALVPVSVGDKIVSVDRHRSNADVRVCEIVSISKSSAMVVPYNGPLCPAAVSAAVDKSFDYHCRRPYYIQQVIQGVDPTLDEDLDLLPGEFCFEED